MCMHRTRLHALPALARMADGAERRGRWLWVLASLLPLIGVLVPYCLHPTRQRPSVLLSASPTAIRVLATLPAGECTRVTVLVRRVGVSGRGRGTTVTAEALHSPLDSELHALAEVRRLRASTEHEYEVRCQAAAVASGTFRTPPAPGRSLLRFGFGSCILPTPFAPLAPFDSFFSPAGGAGQIDFFLSLGDTVYGDLYKHLRGAYAALWRAKGFGAFAARTPLLATFDDHETGVNDPEDAAATPAFEAAMAYWHLRLGAANPTAAPLREAPSGVRARRWFSYRAGGADLFVADTVTHRASHPPGRWSPLGREQALALRRWLRRPAPAKVIATSIPFAMGSGLPLSSRLLPWNQNHTNYYRASPLHAWLLAALRKQRRPVLLLSGDVHGAAAYSLGGGGAHEVVCAPLHNLATESIVGAERLPAAEGTEKVWQGAPGWQHAGVAEVDTRDRRNASLTVSVWRYGVFWPRTPQLAYRWQVPLDLG